MLNVRYTKQMKRFFVFFSIFLLLGSNLAMALDVDCLQLKHQQSMQDYDQDTSHTDGEYSDNCCHSASHFVGIYPDNLVETPTIVRSYIPLPFKLTTTQIYQPATPPPTV